MLLLGAALTIQPAAVHGQAGPPGANDVTPQQHSIDKQDERTGPDTPVFDFSIGIAGSVTSCYSLAAGGPVCRGSFAGEIPGVGCGIRDGCYAEYLGPSVSLARHVNAWFAVAGEATMLVGWLEPPDNASSLLIGPRLTTWRVFGQVLMGHQWHQVFPDGLVVQPGAGIDVWHVRMQVDYGYFEPIPRLSGVRYQVAYVARFGSLTRR